MHSSFWIDAFNLEWSIVQVKGSPVLISKQNCNFSLKIISVLANSVDPDEMPHYAAFNLDFICLQLKLQINDAFIPLLTE